MWPRKRLDIGWGDLLYGLWRVAFPPNSARMAARIEKLWPEPERTFACLSVRSGFDLLLGALALPRGSEVLVSAVTIPDMLRILERHGLIPVPVDLDPRQAAPRPEAWTNAVTPNVRAILVAHLFGGRAAMEPILDIARRYRLLVFEDCAQAFAGIGCPGHPQADASLFSFGVIKSNTALGGAVLQVRDREILARMRAAQSAYPRQRRRRYFLRLVKCGLLKALCCRPICGLFVRICRALGGDYDRWVNRAAQGFPGGELFDQIRRRPSAPLLAMLHRRLRRFDARRWERHSAQGRMLFHFFRELENREWCVLCPGAENAPHSYWVFPILFDEPKRLTEDLARHGFDATQGQSLCVVPPPNGRRAPEARSARTMLDKIVFLPFYPELPPCEARRMAVIARACLDRMRFSDKNTFMEAIIHIDDRLFHRAQAFAQASGQSVDAFISQSIEKTLENQSEEAKKGKYCFPRDRGGGVLPGVDLSNSAELLDIMEEGLDVSKRR
ncbi:MAG: DegT/DnrJ/EryC1/StrS aminotransferase family protein [Pirellulales bacterium]|nr:DegT/DnrJ/EryC1/StrS aminotransferase family protein [Pirellulales bacterium]